MASSSARYSAGTFSSEGVAALTMFTNAVSRDWFIPLAAAVNTVKDVFGQFQCQRWVAHERFLSAVVEYSSLHASCRALWSLHRFLDLNTLHRRLRCREAIGQVVLRGVRPPWGWAGFRRVVVQWSGVPHLHRPISVSGHRVLAVGVNARLTIPLLCPMKSCGVPARYRRPIPSPHRRSRIGS